MSALTAIHMARKPLIGTVASNALKYGTGALNIKGTRIGTESVTINTWDDGAKPFGGGAGHPFTGRESQGRWPANLIIQHKPGCELVGTKRIKTQWGQPTERTSSITGVVTYGEWAPKEDGRHIGYGDPDGIETVDAWDCAPGCPVAELDEQSGVRRSTWTNVTDPKPSTAKPESKFRPGQGNYMPQGPLYADEGGASRFFKQVRNEYELVEYLRDMASISSGHVAFVIGDLDRYMLESVEWGAESFVGFIVRGVPTEEQVARMMSHLMPGGHLFLIAPDHQPTGHVGACRLEDGGFEIRDCLLWVRGAERLHYVPKAARKEREAGCGLLKGKAGHEAVERKEGSAGVQNPRAGAGRTAEHVKNFHPTVKPIALMERLLGDVPKDAVVLDPFLGSGTTAIACTKTGHSFIGIERSPEYLEIADARVRHWDSAHQGWTGADIVSDHEPPEEEATELTLDDLFG